MNKDQENFIRKNFTGVSTNLPVGMMQMCEEHPELTLQEILGYCIDKTTDENYPTLLIKAAKFLAENADYLGIKTG